MYIQSPEFFVRFTKHHDRPSPSSSDSRKSSSLFFTPSQFYPRTVNGLFQLEIKHISIRSVVVFIPYVGEQSTGEIL